ncbi:metallophosphoesterase [Natrialba swarupiae]|uniref:Phosphoesterase n=1 Tax=Natrialba swarupiae TaxID=2448032 RepID=A0A5D5API2_9EURY|nr:metallophosphoesterase [Natrialba swarupiae]TYT63729.1 metallophosphoesterase family protein [Natrialba swarupiae]
MNIGIIADTHDNVDAAERAAEIFAEEGVEIVVHCGDFIAPPLLSALEGFEVHGVLGNNDGEISGLEVAFDDLGSESELHGRFASLEFDGLSVAVLHGESKAEVEALADAETYDVVCYGHHHERERTERGRTTVLNPGGQFPTIPDDHRTVAILDTRSESVRFRSVLE